MKSFKQFCEQITKHKYHYFNVIGPVHHEFETAKNINKRGFVHLPGKSKDVGNVGMYDRDPEVVKQNIVDFLAKKGYKESDYKIQPTQDFSL